MLKLIVSDDFIDVVSNMPIMCLNDIFGCIVAFDDVSQEEADEFKDNMFLKFYERINNGGKNNGLSN